MEREYVEEIIKSMNRPNEDEDEDDDDEDVEMQWAMRQSRVQHEFEHYHGGRVKSGYYDDVGGSHMLQINRSQSVRDTGFGTGRNPSFQPASTPLSRLREREVQLERIVKRKNKQNCQRLYSKRQKRLS